MASATFSHLNAINWARADYDKNRGSSLFSVE